MVKNERYFLDYFSFLICFNSYFFQFMHPGWDATMQEYHYDIHIPHFNSCARDGRNTLDEDIIIKIKISIHAPAMGATARFRYYLAICIIFSICTSLLYAIIFNRHLCFLYLILGNVRKKVFRYSSGLFNMIFHIVFISLQIRTFCFARVIAV